MRTYWSRCINGFVLTWHLHTPDGIGRSSYLQRQRITAEEAASMQAWARDGQGNIVEPRTRPLGPGQKVYSAARRCECNTPSEVTS